MIETTFEILLFGARSSNERIKIEQILHTLISKFYQLDFKKIN